MVRDTLIETRAFSFAMGRGYIAFDKMAASPERIIPVASLSACIVKS